MNTRPSIVFLDSETVNKGDVDFSVLETLGELTTYDYSEANKVAERIKNADIIICNKTIISSALIDEAHRLKYIVVSATGYNNIDLEAAKSKGIAVSNVSGYSTSSVAQHVFALLLAYYNRVESYNDKNKLGAWSKQKLFSYWDHPIEELSDKTLGILGLGTIGRAVAQIALAFGMKVIATHRHPERDALSGVEFVDLDILFQKSDILSLHVPLNESTKFIINRLSLMKMNTHSIIINTSRGGLINEPDLAEALKNNQIQAALLDVLSEEPPSSEQVLIGPENVFTTPHQAWASKQSRQRLIKGVEDNIKAFLEGNPQNLV